MGDRAQTIFLWATSRHLRPQGGSGVCRFGPGPGGSGACVGEWQFGVVVILLGVALS